MVIAPNQPDLGSRDQLISDLTEVVYNLRWSWQATSALSLFRGLAPEAWAIGHNPVAVLRAAEEMEPSLLAEHAEAIGRAKADLEHYLGRSNAAASPRVGYLCAEFAIAECLPIYSGGLGVLAGDHLKAASDLGLPLVAVGLLYGYGYFSQSIDETGYQRERYERIHSSELPLRPLLRVDGGAATIDVPFPGRTVRARVWHAQVGRIPLYLLDTDLPENREDDRWITGHLYGGDQDTRIRQEMVLGIGGARLLKLVGATAGPRDVYHLNEGHSAFITLELAREQLAAGTAATFDEALERVARDVVFTTHTPVAAGHDAFPADLVEAYFGEYREQLGLSHADFMKLGSTVVEGALDRFSMTVLALRGAVRRNGVSQLHGIVSQRMWSGVGVGVRDLQPSLEMGAITNGIHTATWAGRSMSAVFDSELGPGWRLEPQRPESWLNLAHTDDEVLWQARTAQRAQLLSYVHRMAQAGDLGGLAPGVTAEQVLVLGFARRFATYKRAALLLEHPERLAALLGGNAERQVVLIFAGKAHPRDDAGKLLIQRIVQAARDERFRGRLLFLEDYDVAIARLLVQGSDVWLNTPRRTEEASGTSGMKAVLNGALHLSELDGWWDEAYEAGLGWGLGAGLPQELGSAERDAAEAGQLADLLEQEIVPLFFGRNAEGFPSEWLDCVRRSILTLAPQFSAQRMVIEYRDQIYRPTAAKTE